MVFKTLCNYQLFGSAKTNFTSGWGKNITNRIAMQNSEFPAERLSAYRTWGKQLVLNVYFVISP